MRKISAWLMLLAALMLGGLFLFPVWHITLYAPQYPDGITMFIWINKITGNSPGTLQNINILNHYVGMQNIEPDSIPELQYFPYVIGFMALAGMVLAFLKKSYLFLGWTVLLVILGVLGMYDFYLWQYDYGHNLSPTAPIKVPGMAYQPPLFGRKMLLNFEALSYPSLGSLFYGLSIVFGTAAFFRRSKESKQ